MFLRCNAIRSTSSQFAKNPGHKQDITEAGADWFGAYKTRCHSFSPKVPNIGDALSKGES